MRYLDGDGQTLTIFDCCVCDERIAEIPSVQKKDKSQKKERSVGNAKHSIIFFWEHGEEVPVCANSSSTAVAQQQHSSSSSRTAEAAAAAVVAVAAQAA